MSIWSSFSTIIKFYFKTSFYWGVRHKSWCYAQQKELWHHALLHHSRNSPTQKVDKKRTRAFKNGLHVNQEHETGWVLWEISARIHLALSFSFSVMLFYFVAIDISSTFCAAWKAEGQGRSFASLLPSLSLVLVFAELKKERKYIVMK